MQISRIGNVNFRHSFNNQEQSEQLFTLYAQGEQAARERKILAQNQEAIFKAMKQAFYAMTFNNEYVRSRKAEESFDGVKIKKI